MLTSLSLDTKVKQCKIKVETVPPKPVSVEKFLSARQFRTTRFSQTKVHLLVFENTVDLLCESYRWISSLCTVKRIVPARGSTFPVTMKKTFTAQIILYPCGAPENTITATVNEIMAM